MQTNILYALYIMNPFLFEILLIFWFDLCCLQYTAVIVISFLKINYQIECLVVVADTGGVAHLSGETIGVQRCAPAVSFAC